MYKILGIFFLPALLAEVVIKNTIDIQKQVNLRTLTSRTFHAYNKGHVLVNYGCNLKDEKAHLSNFHNLGYTGWMTIGTPGQSFNVIFDTAISDVLILSAKRCAYPRNLFSRICWTQRKYEEGNSFKYGEGYLWGDADYPIYSINYGKENLEGHLIFENLKIANVAVEKQLIGLLEEFRYSFLYSKADGIVGVGRSKDSKFAAQNVVGPTSNTNLARIKQSPTFTQALSSRGASKIGFHLYKDKGGNEVGQMIVGADDEHWRYLGQIKWHSTSSGEYWKLRLSSMKFVGMADGHVETLDLSSTTGIPDPGTSLFAGPPNIINKINEYLFKGMVLPKQKSIYGTIQFDCAYLGQLPIIALFIQAQAYLLEPREYVKRFQLGYCTSGFMAVENLRDLIIGDVFIRRYYTVFDGSNGRVGFADFAPPKVTPSLLERYVPKLF